MYISRVNQGTQHNTMAAPSMKLALPIDRSCSIGKHEAGMEGLRQSLLAMCAMYKDDPARQEQLCGILHACTQELQNGTPHLQKLQQCVDAMGAMHEDDPARHEEIRTFLRICTQGEDTPQLQAVKQSLHAMHKDDPEEVRNFLRTCTQEQLTRRLEEGREALHANLGLNKEQRACMEKLASIIRKNQNDRIAELNENAKGKGRLEFEEIVSTMPNSGFGMRLKRGRVKPGQTLLTVAVKQVTASLNRPGEKVLHHPFSCMDQPLSVPQEDNCFRAMNAIQGGIILNNMGIIDFEPDPEIGGALEEATRLGLSVCLEGCCIRHSPVPLPTGMNGNCVNDGTAGPKGGPTRPNCAFRLGKTLDIVSTHDIILGDELLLNYGGEYWEDKDVECHTLPEKVRAHGAKISKLLAQGMTLDIARQMVGGMVQTGKQKKVKPNLPCPCGSGKKFKKCCDRAGN